MAGINTRYGNSFNQPTREYIVTSEAEIDDLPTTTANAKGKFADDVNFRSRPAIGSTCKVIEEDGTLSYYILRENGWIKVKSSISGGSGGSGSDNWATNEDIDRMFES